MVNPVRVSFIYLFVCVTHWTGQVFPNVYLDSHCIKKETCNSTPLSQCPPLPHFSLYYNLSETQNVIYIHSPSILTEYVHVRVIT